jgi:hypothetical protein
VRVALLLVLLLLSSCPAELENGGGACAFT